MKRSKVHLTVTVKVKESCFVIVVALGLWKDLQNSFEVFPPIPNQEKYSQQNKWSEPL